MTLITPELEGSPFLGPPIRLSKVSVSTQTSMGDWVDLVSHNHNPDCSKFCKTDLISLPAKSGVDLLAANQVDLLSQTFISKFSELTGNELASLVN